MHSAPLLALRYRDELLRNVIPFWLRHSLDRENGGYFTCLDRGGRVYDTDKFLWLQGRQVWTFAMLYDSVERRQEWLEAALHGARFLKEHGRDPDGNWYFSLTREGRPLVQPYSIFADCFAAMGFARLGRITGDAEDARIALETFQSILRRRENPKGPYSKVVPGTRPLKGFALPMIISNLALEIEPLLSREDLEKILRESMHEVMHVFRDPESGLVRETVDRGGGFSDSFEGRLLNPGHAIEAMWFMMECADRIGDQGAIRLAVECSLRTLEHGWDREFGGVFAFLDLRGAPPQQLEWDQKLWWVHLETLVALLSGYARTKDERCLAWFEKVHDYTWSHFPDPEYGEWYGYLNRRGEVLLPLKGGKWKGCFHLPRALVRCWRLLETLGA